MLRITANPHKFTILVICLKSIHQSFPYIYYYYIYLLFYIYFYGVKILLKAHTVYDILFRKGE